MERCSPNMSHKQPGVKNKSNGKVKRRPQASPTRHLQATGSPHHISPTLPVAVMVKSRVHHRHPTPVIYSSQTRVFAILPDLLLPKWWEIQKICSKKSKDKAVTKKRSFKLWKSGKFFVYIWLYYLTLCFVTVIFAMLSYDVCSVKALFW